MYYDKLRFGQLLINDMMMMMMMMMNVACWTYGSLRKDLFLSCIMISYMEFKSTVT